MPFDRNRDTETREVHAYMNAVGGGKFHSFTSAPPVHATPPPTVQPQHTVLPTNIVRAPHKGTTYLPSPPVINTTPYLPLPYFPYGGGGGGGSTPEQQPATQPNNIVVIEPAKYVERKNFHLKPLANLQNNYPQAIIDTKQYYNKGGTKYMRVIRFVEPEGGQVDATVYSNGRRRKVYVGEYNIAEDQSLLYDSADGKDKNYPNELYSSKEQEDAAVKKGKETKPEVKFSVPFVDATKQGRFVGGTVGVLIGVGFAFNKKKGIAGYLVSAAIGGAAGFVAGYALDKTVLKK